MRHFFLSNHRSTSFDHFLTLHGYPEVFTVFCVCCFWENFHLLFVFESSIWVDQGLILKVNTKSDAEEITESYTSEDKHWDTVVGQFQTSSAGSTVSHMEESIFNVSEFKRPKIGILLLDSANGNLSFFALESHDVLLGLHLTGFETCGQGACLEIVLVSLGSELLTEDLAGRQLNLTASHFSLLHRLSRTFEHLRSFKAKSFALHVFIERTCIPNSLLLSHINSWIYLFHL